MLALLVEARASSGWPVYSHFVGIDTRPRVASLAAEALAGAPVEIIAADASGAPLPACDAALLFDVLHMMPVEQQETLLSAVKSALRPGGVVLVREADANTGWRFAVVRIGNRLKAMVGRNWKQHFAFRQPDEWIACFEAHGFRVETFPGPASHPFGNTLFRLTSSAAGTHDAAILNA
jgi:SAM-dependent methyltransferase